MIYAIHFSLSLCLYFDGLSLSKLLNTSRFVNRSHTAIRTGYKNMNLKRYPQKKERMNALLMSNKSRLDPIISGYWLQSTGI